MRRDDRHDCADAAHGRSPTLGPGDRSVRADPAARGESRSPGSRPGRRPRPPPRDGPAGAGGRTRSGPASSRRWRGQLRTTILVVGTNGKTTTAGLIAEMLRRPDGPPIANRSGANMRQGIVTSLVRASDLRGHLRSGELGGRTASSRSTRWPSARSFPTSDRRSSSRRTCFGTSWIATGRPTRSSTAGRRPWRRPPPAASLVYCADDPRLAMLAADTTLPSRSFGLAGAPADRRDRPGTTTTRSQTRCRAGCAAGSSGTRGGASAISGPSRVRHGHVERATPDLSDRVGRGRLHPTAERCRPCRDDDASRERTAGERARAPRADLGSRTPTTSPRRSPPRRSRGTP